MAYIKDNDEWTIVTLARVVWKHAGQLHSVNLEEIKDATVPDSVLSQLSPRVKRQLSQLKIVSGDGVETIAPFEAGKPFAGFWNVVKQMIAGKKKEGEKG